jgi:hypothetical protein
VRVLIGIFLIVGSIKCFGQTPFQLLQNSDTTGAKWNGIAAVNASAEAGSTFLAKNCVQPFLSGGNLALNARVNALNRIQSLGIFGGDTKLQLRYYGGYDSLFSTRNLGMLIQAGTRYWGSATVGKNAFELLALGNSQLVGDTVTLNTIQGELLGYQFIGGGIYDKRNLSFLSLSLVNGLTHKQLQMAYPSFFYTSENVDTLELNYSGNYWQTQSGRKTSNGIGFVLDGEYNYCSSRAVVGKELWSSVGVRNLGWIKWNELSSLTSFDSSLTWTGVNLNELLNGGSILNGESFADTLVVSNESRSYWRPTRGSIYLRSVYLFRPKLRLMIQMDFFPAPLNPQITLGTLWNPTEQLQVCAEVSRGGFTHNKFGIGVSYFINDQWQLGLKTNNIVGYISQNALSMSGFINLSYLIKPKK